MSSIREIISTFGDDAIIALGNKGLLRRGKKDLEGGVEIRIDREDETAIQMTISEFEVTLPAAGPTACTCTCPSLDFCRHIICAILFLRGQTGEKQDSTAPAEIPPVPEDTSKLNDYLLNLSLKKLQKAGGKKSMQEALELCETGEAEFSWDKQNLTCSFENHGITVHFLHGLDLDGAICNGEAARKKVFILAAVLHFQKKNGKTWDPEEQKELLQNNSPGGAPRSREQILDTVDSLLQEMVTVGLSHLSPTFGQRLETLAISATGVELPRLSLSLRNLAEETSLILERNARSSEENLFRGISQTFALCRALADNPATPQPHLVGMSRSKYDAIDDLRLDAISAYRWETKSNYAGITVLFWDERKHELYSWSDARPMFNSFGFTPQQRYQGDAPWSGGATLRKISHSRIHLKQPKKNYQNRLSASSDTSFSIEKEANYADLDFGPRLFTNWHVLLAYHHLISPLGLAEANPSDGIVVVKPTKWNRRGYDPVKQRFYWLLEDENRNLITLAVPFDSVNENSIKLLENLSPRRSTLLVCRIDFAGSFPHLYPFTVLDGKKAVNLTLDPPKKSLKSSLYEKLKEKWKDPSPSPAEWEDEIRINPKTILLEGKLQALAESGSRTLTKEDAEQLRQLGEDLQAQSLELLAGYLSKIISDDGSRAQNLIRANYINHLGKQLQTRLEP